MVNAHVQLMFTTTKSKNGENYKSNNIRNLKDKTITETERRAKTKKAQKFAEKMTEIIVSE